MVKRANTFLVTDKFGTALALVKSDIGGNVSVCFCELLYPTLMILYTLSDDLVQL